MVWPELRKLRRAFVPTKSRGNQRKKSKEKKEEDPLRLQQVHPGGEPARGWIETDNVEDSCGRERKVICNDKGVKLLLKDGSWSSDDNTNDRHHQQRVHITDAVSSDDFHQLKVELEHQVAELQLQLAEERQNVNRECAQEMRDGLRHELERERLLRMQAEARLEESEIYRATLQQDLCKMEEIAKSGVQLKCQLDRLQEEKSSLTATYQSQLHKYQSCVASLQKENLVLYSELKSLQAMQSKEGCLSRMLLDRVRFLEQENSSLVLENEQQRLQYEWCLDDVGRQVVRALVAQKGLREECLLLQRQIRDLEEQNLALGTALNLKHSRESLRERKAFSDPFPMETDRYAESSLGSQSEDSLASFCSQFSFLGGSCEIGVPGSAKMSSPLRLLRPESLSSCRLQTNRSSWAGISPLHDDPALRLWQRYALWPELSLDAVDTPSDESSPSIVRPNTLDIVPDLVGNPSCNFDFPALQKNSRDGACENVYEEIDLPQFPSTNDDSPQEEQQQDTNTVVRRVSLSNPVPPLPPDRLKPQRDASSGESPLSVGGSRDEGYSTMSSDVQCDVAPPKLVPRTVVGRSDVGMQMCALAVRRTSEEMESFFESGVRDVVVCRESSGLRRVSSFGEPPEEAVHMVAAHHRSSFDPSYEKIFKLLTPQGFTRNTNVSTVRSVSHQSEMNIVVLPNFNVDSGDVSDIVCDSRLQQIEKSADASCGGSEHIEKNEDDLLNSRGHNISSSDDKRPATSFHIWDVNSRTVDFSNFKRKFCSRSFSDSDLTRCNLNDRGGLVKSTSAINVFLGSEFKDRVLNCPLPEQETENRHLVEEWLQTGNKLQNGYAYDEEEVGNWSLDLSAEDLSQVVGWDKELEGCSWSAPLFHNKEASGDEPGVIQKNDSSAEEEETVRNVEHNEQEEEDEAEAVTTEFNRDFYRLCNLGSVRSLADRGEQPQTDPRSKKNKVVVARRKESRTRIPVSKTSHASRANKATREQHEKKPEKGDLCLETSATVADKIQQLTALLKEEDHRRRQSRIPNVSPPDRRACQRRLWRKKEGCGTSWVHFEADVDLSDPKARANLLDSMVASSSSSGSSSEAEDGDQVVEHRHHQRLHALHRFRRHRKRVTDPDNVISYLPPRLRASIVDRNDFFFRFGEKEREAVACFDFLDDLSTSPSDDAETLRRLRDDCISLSDSCAESFSSSTHSLNRIV